MCITCWVTNDQVSQEPTVAPTACQVLTAAELAAVAPE
jgi:hypothetical protein